MDVVELLTQFNLTRQEATIYIALHTEGDSTGYEVAKLTGISRSNAYTSLASLVDKGAAYVMEGSANRYTAVALEEFCTNNIRRMQELKQKLISVMPQARAQPTGYITVKGGNHILDKMQTMIVEADERVYLSLSKKILEHLLPALRDGLLRGIKVVIITDIALDLPGATIYRADKEANQIRLIADSTDVLTGDISDGAESTCLYSRSKNLIDLFKDALRNEITLIELRKGGNKL